MITQRSRGNGYTCTLRIDTLKLDFLIAGTLIQLHKFSGSPIDLGGVVPA